MTVWKLSAELAEIIYGLCYFAMKYKKNPKSHNNLLKIREREELDKRNWTRQFVEERLKWDKCRLFAVENTNASTGSFPHVAVNS